MFKEQYHRDNEKLHAKETLLMEIKNRDTKEGMNQTERIVRRNRFVRYGAVAAAVLLVVGGALGIALSGRAKSDPMSMEQNSMVAAADTGSAASVAGNQVLSAADVANDTVRSLNSYEELYGLIEGMRARDAALYGMNDGAVMMEAAAPEAAPAAAEESVAADMEAPVGTSAPTSGAGTADAKMADADEGADYSETNLQVIGVDEADILKTDGKYIYYIANNQLNILSADGANTKLVSSTMFTGDDKWWGYASEMFLLKDRLMIITQGYSVVWAKIAGNGYNQTQEQTQVLIYDVSDPAKPRRISEMGQSGNYVSSRMIGDMVYLITSHYVWQPVREQPITYVPRLIEDGAERAVPANDIMVYGTPKNMAYTVIGGINLASGTDYASVKAVFGGTGTVYCSAEHLLLANGEYDRQVSPIAPDENGKNVQVTTNTSNTRLMLFTLDQENITLTASATIPGTLLNQFAMDEYKGVFRLVSTCNNWVERIYTDGVDTYEYEDETYNCLYALDETLTVIGKLENLAKDEWIESVRFDGDIGYFVTFRQVDPLFAVDLSNPKAPKVLSELKIPGFSEYLHRYGDGLLLGLGYEADEKTGSTKGVKLSMFDIHNARDVKELTTSRIDASWTSVGSNHKAILVSVEKNLIAFPADDSYYIYSYAKEAGFTQLAKVRMENDLNSWNLRGLFIGDYFYVLGGSGVSVISMNSWEKIAHVTISYG